MEQGLFSFSNIHGCLREMAVRNGSIDLSAALVNKTGNIVSSYMVHFQYAHSFRLKTRLAGKYGFIAEFKRARPLVFPRFFPNLARQYGFFKNSLSGISFYGRKWAGLFQGKTRIDVFSDGALLRFLRP